MKLKFFSSTDYTFCELETCSRKKDCMRYFHHKEYDRFKNHPRLSFMMIKNSENCLQFRDNRIKENNND